MYELASLNLPKKGSSMISAKEQVNTVQKRREELTRQTILQANWILTSSLLDDGSPKQLGKRNLSSSVPKLFSVDDYNSER